MDKESALREIISGVTEFAPEFKRVFMTVEESDKRSHKLTSLQYMTLVVLGMAGEQPLNMNKLSALLNISKQQTTKLVDGLVDTQLVSRYTNPSNRREVLAELTLEGFDALEKIRRSKCTAVLGYLENYTDEDMTEILTHVRALIDIFHRKKGEKECEEK